ncbi:MAG: DUF2298 domain-containing protein [Chloroflexi bacterium]|nr:DUF2298 domain-containing protein [Chloroflexota bacterium]
MTDILIWYLWMQAFAFGGWMVASPWLRNLPDRGYGISKALGIILVGFAYWLAVILGLSRNESGAILLALALVVLAGLGLRALNQRPGIRTTGTPYALRSSVIITTEIVFALGFIACAVYRAYNPDIVEAGGEKFMESMMLNAILRSPSFPPNDAWLSGFSISYYYFGYVMMAMLARISGTAPGIAFNLGGATFFALTLVSAFSVGYNLWALNIRRSDIEIVSPDKTSQTPGHAVPSSLIAGLLTALMLAVMGNLGGFMESVRCARVLPQTFWTWLDVRQIDTKPVECKGLLPTRFYWWWDWSRVIHDYTPAGADQEVITESPAFSFILGDNHPHVMSLPFVLLAVTLAIRQLARPGKETNPESEPEPEPKPQHSALSTRHSTLITALALDGMPWPRWLSVNSPDLLLTAIVIGGLSFMNTWDFPVYGALLVGALLLRRWYCGDTLVPGLVFGALVFVLGYLCYLPFYANFASQARGIGVNLFNGTRFAQFFLMFAPFVMAAPLFTLYVMRARRAPVARTAARSLALTAVGLCAALIAMVLLGLLSSQGRAYAAELASNGTVMGVTRETVTQRLLQRLADPWVPLFLAGVASMCAVLILAHPSSLPASQTATQTATQKPALINAFVLLLFLGGALLTLAVEFIYLQDLFGTRMNTVFKFYYQAWTVWAVAGAFALMTFLDSKGILTGLGALLVGFLLLAGLLFPIYAAISRTDSFSAKPTLDGSAYLQDSKPDDARMIAWLNENVDGDPVIVEAPAGRYGAYSYNGRISAFTGLPTLLGWSGHEHQWRGNYDEPARREPLIETLYNTTDDEEARSVLETFNVRYVIVGETERAQYTPEGLAKFEQLCSVAYQAGDSRVYQCQ